jgi:hypothetical protein
MIQTVLHRNSSLVIAWSDGMQWRRGDTSHGWQDKSADVRRAHVVGWTELSQPCTSCPAGASHRNTNEIRACDAVAPCETLVLPL